MQANRTMKQLHSIKDNLLDDQILVQDQLETLLPVAGRSLAELIKDNENLLIFPNDLNEYGDKLGENSLVELVGGKIKAGNVLGYVGLPHCQSGQTLYLNIHSRFDPDSNQFLMHYMLQKIFSLSIFDWQTHTDYEDVWDFIFYLFPRYLRNALAQGLFRSYRKFHYNNDRLKGTLEVPRHIQHNVPFVGYIAYSTREHTENNSLMHLVRHTIEYLKTTPLGVALLIANNTIAQDVQTVILATPDYKYQERDRVIMQNLRPVRHPFYTEYAALQKLCLQILFHEVVNYGDEESSIYGILFDGAWLWEEYLATILVDFKHPRNKKHEDGVRLYKKKAINCYPDFYSPNMVIDAKYKHLNNYVQPEDRYQVITYMYRLGLKKAFLLYPTSDIAEKFTVEGELDCNNGGSVCLLPFHIPQHSTTFHNIYLLCLRNAKRRGQNL